MKKLIFVAMAMVASVTFAEKKAAAKKETKATAPAAALMDVTGAVNWTGYGVGKSHHGQISVKSGQVEFKGNDLVGGHVDLDMGTLKTGDSARLEGHLKSEDFFDVEKYSTATFKITKVEAIANAKAGEPNYKITGDLTIKTKTNSETFMAVVTKIDKGYTAVAKSQITDRTKYDIVYNSAKFKTASALGDKLIEDKIDVELNLQTN